MSESFIDRLTLHAVSRGLTQRAASPLRCRARIQGVDNSEPQTNTDSSVFNRNLKLIIIIIIIIIMLYNTGGGSKR